MKRRIVPHIVQRRELFTLAPEMSIRAAATLMTERRIGAIMVVRDGKLLGILSERDVMTRVVAKHLDPDTTLVGQVMTPEPMTIRPDDTAAKALHLMHERGFRHLPVTDDTGIVAMVSIRDLYAAVQEELEEDIRQRESYMFGSGYGATQ
ncbi:MAG: CBS domain-containing protein [Alphaproteobacteria bacterium]|nr:CBS domain-containing protein [Alphaproteobacteria bacterium]TAD87533.1 MAG: CBS domain-containing protein [Alphaproteobacteria bacterium]